MLIQGCDKTVENMLVHTELIANVLWMTIKKLKDPVSSSECQSVIGSFIVERETISKCCSTSSKSEECKILKKLLLFVLTFSEPLVSDMGASLLKRL